MPAVFDFTNKAFDDIDEESSGSDELQEIILQQSVTMLAYMDHVSYNSTGASKLSEPRTMFGVNVDDLALVLGVTLGVAGIMVVVLSFVIIWYCYKIHQSVEKTYCLSNSLSDEMTFKQGDMHHSDSVVFLESKANQVSTCSLSLKRDLKKSFMTRSQSAPLREDKEVPKLLIISKPFSKRRPQSQPAHLPFSQAPHSPKKTTHPYTYQHLPNCDVLSLALPSIPESVLRSSEFLHETPSHNIYASCNALDGPRTYSSLYSAVTANTTMKTRSLPLWGRSKLRPLSTEDDLNELYAKVNFSKKRKNRMRSDSAAAIAVNKSRTSFSSKQFVHKDTDSLVENEAVVVYDERTSL